MSKYCIRELSTFLPYVVGGSVLKMSAATYSSGDLRERYGSNPAEMANATTAGRRTLRVWEEVELLSISFASSPKLEDTEPG